MIATLTLLVSSLLLPAAQEAVPEPAQEQTAAPETPAAPSMSADEHINLGLASFKKKRFAAARKHFQEAVDASPDSAAAHFYLGYSIYKIAEPKRPNSPGKQEAAGHFAKAYELDPGFKPAWHGRS